MNSFTKTTTLRFFTSTHNDGPSENEKEKEKEKEKPYCDIHIRVLLNNATKMFDISYTYSYSCEMGKLAHPFAKYPYLKKYHEEGELIKYNDLSRTLIQYLLMNDSELKKQIGHSTTQHYRTMILKSIANFWD